LFLANLVQNNLQQLSSFISIHSKTLEVLDSNYHSYSDVREIDPDMFPSIRGENQQLGAERQPGLSSFRGGAYILLHLLNSGLRSLFTRLEYLELADEDVHPIRLTDALHLNIGRKICTFSPLRRFSLNILVEPPGHLDRELVTGWLYLLRLLIKRCQAKLEVLVLDFHFRVHAKKNASRLPS
jgi:hypothetical protein